MSFKLPPYLKWRDGRPRWEPGPRLRHAFKGCDLKDDAGNWLRLEAAIAKAKALNAEVTSWKAGGEAPRRPKVSRAPARTCQALWELWASPSDPAKASPYWKKLAAVSKRDYKSKIGVFLATKTADGHTFADEPFAAIKQSDMFTFWEDMCRERGHAMANGILACVRTMMSYGVMKGWRAINPAKAIRIIKLEPRVVVWTPSEVEGFVATADEMQLFGVGDAVVIGLHTAQRQGDVLRLEEAASSRGRSNFRQGKTGARVSVPFTPALNARLEAIKLRRRAGQVAELMLTGPLVRDANGAEYTSRRFNRDFVAVRDAMARKQLAGGANDASILGRQYLDLRDTAITRLALAGCTVAEIRAISGHSLETIHQVLQHYLALDDRMADAGIDRLKIWMAEEGIAI